MARPVIGAAVAAAMFGAPLLLGAVPAVTAAPEVPAETAATVRAVPVGPDAAEAAALLARDEASASRAQVRPTPAPAVAAGASAGPSVPAPPAPEPVVSAEPSPPAPAVVVATLWVTTEVNVRTGPSADSDRLGSLAALDQVGSTGTAQDGWTQVVVDGQVGWVNSSYLSTTAPEPTASDGPASETASGPLDAPCGIDPEIEPNLTAAATAVYRAVCAAYGGSVSSFGGYRPGDDGDHGSGRAVDVMVSGEPGWEIARFLQARAGEFGITYLLYEQQSWTAGDPPGAWENMSDRGSVTANHFDHVHVSVG